MASSGLLSIVATPIGNLDDITLRALKVLKGADTILAEDTRHTRGLLSHHGIDRPMVALHEHNEEAKVASLVDELLAGAKLALVSDAGTPAINDPGFRLVRAARAAGVKVESIPGASAVLAALVASGLPTDAFAFVGFPPRKAGERDRWARRALSLGMTVVFFESPQRLPDTLETLASLAPGREAVVARELTKKFEEYRSGTLTDVLADFTSRDEIKGEITVVLAPGDAIPEGTVTAFDLDAEIARLRAEGKGDSEIAKAIAKATGRKKSDVYADLIREKD